MKRVPCLIISLALIFLAGCNESSQPLGSMENAPTSVQSSPTLPRRENGSIPMPTVSSQIPSEQVIETVEASTPESIEETQIPTESTLPQKYPEEDPEVNKKPTTVPEATAPAATESIPTPQPQHPQDNPTEPSVPVITEPIPTEPPATLPKDDPTEPPVHPAEPTEPVPAECQHDWICTYHEEQGHWISGVVCDCGWTLYGDPESLVPAWNAHSASYPPEDSLFEHGGFGCADEWITDLPAYSDWYCAICGEAKP